MNVPSAVATAVTQARLAAWQRRTGAATSLAAGRLTDLAHERVVEWARRGASGTPRERELVARWLTESNAGADRDVQRIVWRLRDIVPTAGARACAEPGTRQAWLERCDIALPWCAERVRWLRELVLLRNRRARALGFADGFHHALSVQGLATNEVLGLASALADGLGSTWNTDLTAWAARLGRDVGPWDLVDDTPAVQDSVGVLQSAWRALGFGAAPPVVASGPGSGAETFFVDPPRDVRIVLPDGQGLGVATLLHELGHSAFALHMDPGVGWWLRNGSASLEHETAAQLCASFAWDRAWIRDVVAGQDVAPSAREERLRLLFRVVRVRFENALHADAAAAADPVGAWARICSETLRVAGVPGAAPFARSMELIERCGASAIYLLADIGAARLRQRWAPEPGGAVGPALVAAWFRHGLGPTLHDLVGAFDVGPLVTRASAA